MKRRRNPDSKMMKRIGGAVVGGIAGSMVPASLSDRVISTSPLWPIAGAIAGWFITPKVWK